MYYQDKQEELESKTEVMRSITWHQKTMVLYEPIKKNKI